MASFFFEDYQFPSELYNRETGDFTTPIRTLLDFAPHILQELPKDEKEQKSINSSAEDSWTKNFVPTSYFGSLLTPERTKAITEFVIRCGTEYMQKTSEKKYEQERFKEFERQYKRERRRKRRENNRGWFFNRNEPVSSSSESEDEEEAERERMKQKMKQDKEKQKQAAKSDEKKEEKQVLGPSTTAQTLAKSAAAAGVLSLSLYSTYQASARFSEVSFHNQLEMLITQVQSILQSTEVWIEEHDKMHDKIPNRIRSDVIQLKQLLDLLVRLDPRSNKKLEATGWGVGAFGGLSALGGFALGSTAVATGGAALAIGGAIVMISSKASGKSQLGARLLLENQVRERVASCQNSMKERVKMIREEIAVKKEEGHVEIGEKRKLKEEKGSGRTTHYRLQPEEVELEEEEKETFTAQLPKKKKEKVALPN
ncbi:hypothetical protein HMPREF1544_11217 [Mucor circinelloides 1006PhL]|uniref:Uncharacterized protein n=1 Tax=Mucor circinelloides f. circinelloides (strain 1006PhL) TaxID=1220926 RepID=S2J1N4_MUCC1|nr:hypothetical protein HMPREF1544_11217 [Mucor circinelloides 1006PhL]